MMTLLILVFTSSPCWISNRRPPVAVRPRLAESLFAPICLNIRQWNPTEQLAGNLDFTNRSNSPLLWHERKEKPDVLPGSEQMGDISFVLLGGESKSNLTWQNGGFECEEGGASAEEELRLFAQAAS